MTVVRMTPGQRREMVVDAARKILKERGAWPVTHGAVAKRCVAPTSVSTVRHYFPTKEDLVRAASD